MTGGCDDELAADLARRMQCDQQARTRQPVDWDEVAAVDAGNTAWLAVPWRQPMTLRGMAARTRAPC
jgi:hypothetical protein